MPPLIPVPKSANKRGRKRKNSLTISIDADQQNNTETGVPAIDTTVGKVDITAPPAVSSPSAAPPSGSVVCLVCHTTGEAIEMQKCSRGACTAYYHTV